MEGVICPNCKSSNIMLVEDGARCCDCGYEAESGDWDN